MENVPLGQPTQKKRFPEIHKANLGDEIFLVARTENLIGKKLKIEIRQAKERQIVDKDKPIIFNKQDKSGSITITVGKGTKDKDENGLDYFSKYANANKLENFAWKSFLLRPESDNELEQWKKIIESSKEKKINLYFHAEVVDEQDKDAKFLNTDKSEGVQNFANSEGQYFEIENSSCACNRNLSVDEVKNMIRELRDKDAYVKKIYGYNLFSKSNCKIPEKDKTYERFTEELNACFRRYEINTCIRKIYFLAQCYVESKYFTTTQEAGSETYLKSKPYYPFIGRGILQLTHSGDKPGEAGYKQYFKYLGKEGYKTDYEILNKSLHYAVDVSGYFWYRGKLLTDGDTLKSKYPNPKGTYTIFPKKKVDGYTSIDLNLVADDDNVKEVTFLVNGGQNAIDERINFTKEIKNIFNYEKCKNKK